MTYLLIVDDDNVKKWQMLRYIILIIQFCCHLLLMSGLHLQNCPDGYLIFQQNYFWITKFWPAFKLFRLTFRWWPKLDPSLSWAPNWVEIVSCVPFSPLFILSITGMLLGRSLFLGTWSRCSHVLVDNYICFSRRPVAIQSSFLHLLVIVVIVAWERQLKRL